MNAGVVVGGAVAVIALVTAVVVTPRRRRARLVAGAVPQAPVSDISRDALLAKIDETFRSGRFCVLLGGSGVGKTHLAAAFARRSRSPVVWVAAQDPANTVRAYARLSP